MDDHEDYAAAHAREQTEAAVAAACALLERHTRNFVIYARTSPGRYARKISGACATERIAISSGVMADLALLVTDVALCAAKQADAEDHGSQV